MTSEILSYGKSYGTGIGCRPETGSGRSTDGRSTGAGWYTQGCVRPDVGRKTRTVGHRRPPLWGVGDLPRQGITRRRESAVCVADERLVRTADPALQRRRQDVGAGGQQVRV